MAAMADDDIADCIGLSWSELATKLDLKSSDCDDVITTTTTTTTTAEPTTAEPTKADTESMKLKKEEMKLYGLCPAQDEFFLVICEYCHLLVKPQALQYHMDTRHQDYSTSQVHNCAIQLTAIDPIASRNAKCSSHKTNSSVSAQSTNSTTGKPLPRCPARPKGRPATKGGPNSAKNISDKTKPSVDVAPSESNVVSIEKARTGVCADVKSEPVSLAVASSSVAVKSENASEIILPPSTTTTTTTTTVKVEAKDAMLFEPTTHLKISEEKEALVKLLESNEWCNVEIKVEKEEEKEEGLDVKPSFLAPDASQPLRCQKTTTCESSSHANDVATTATSTVAPTTSTCSMSRSSSVVAMLGIATNATTTKGITVNAKSKALTETCYSAAPSQLSTARTLGEGAGDTTISLGKAIALLNDLDETLGNSLIVKSEKTLDPSPVAVVVAAQSNDESSDVSAVARSVSNVISKVQLKTVKGRKSPAEKFLLCKDREFDANKHCGVWMDDIRKQCTRSLTCKSHSLSLRRAVSGRSKLFDQLLSEQRERKLLTKDKTSKFITKLKDKVAAAAATALTPNPTEPSVPIVPSSTSSSSSTSGLGNSSSSSSQDVAPCQPIEKSKKPVAVRPPKSLSVGSREDSCLAPSVGAREEKLDNGAKEEGSAAADGPSVDSYRHCTMSHHPHPAAVNGFNSWVYGRGCYVFNRKEDVYRAAFLAAMEKHLHPPPHKKLCLESNLQTDSTSTTTVAAGVAKDPYDFLFLDSGGNFSASHPLASLSSPTTAVASTKPKPKQTSCSSAQPTSDRKPSASTSSSSIASLNSTNLLLLSNTKRPASSDLVENKRKLARTDVASPDDSAKPVSSSLPSDTIATVTAARTSTSVHLVLPARLDSTVSSLSNGQMIGIPIAEMVATQQQQRRPSTELRIARAFPPHLNRMPARTAAPLALPSKIMPLAGNFVPAYGIAPNASIRLELRPAFDGARLAVDSGAASLISNCGLQQRSIAPSECVTVCARPPSLSSSCVGTIGNSLLKPTTTSLITTNRILTSALPNGTVKLAQRNATINATNQTSLAAILALNHATNAKFAPLSESQAFITSSISGLGRANNQATVVVPSSSDIHKQLNLSAHMSTTTLQLQSAVSGPTLLSSRSGFNVTSAGSSITNRQYIFASGVRHVYQAPVSTTPKKPLAASRVQLLRPELAPAGKTAASTTPLLAGNKCHISGQPI